MVTFDRALLERCCALAEQVADPETFPAGALLAGPDGKVLVEEAGGSRPTSILDHAELSALRRHQVWLEQWPYQVVLYSSLEPCLMCLGAAINAKVRAIVFAVRDEDRQFLEVLGATPYLRYKRSLTEIVAEPDPDLARRSEALIARYWERRGFPPAAWRIHKQRSGGKRD